MAVVASELKFFLSGGASNTDPSLSVGGEMSSTEVSSLLNGLFDAVSAGEATTGLVDYRCIYLQNTNLTNTVNDVKLWIQSQTSSPNTDIAIGLDLAGPNGEAGTDPEEPTYSIPGDVGSGLDMGNLTGEDFYAFWIRRTVNPGASSAASDASQLRISGTPL